jgi:bifunctional non-homologous end joining protein LigD
MPRSTAAASSLLVAGVPISHPDRVVYPELGVTKADIARYYEIVGPSMLSHVRGRPLTLVHCPGGRNACRYLRHSKAWGPPQLRRVRIREKTKVGEYLVADSVEAIVALAQMGVLEIHTWNSTTARLEQPDRIVWDLDPGAGVSWPQTVAAARLLRSVLEVLGLESWVKTTGGRGLHIVVPLDPVRDWSECLAFARGVAQSMERADPSSFTTAFVKAGRERKILIDYLRNNRTNTSVAAFSTRAREGATVSMPIAWTDLKSRPPLFSVASVIRRLRRGSADPWAGYWRAGQRIAPRAIAALRGL